MIVYQTTQLILTYYSFTLAYAVDSYQANTSEMLIAMNLGKQAISFGMG